MFRARGFEGWDLVRSRRLCRRLREIFDPSGFELQADEILRLDPVFQWVLHTAREALRDSGHNGQREGVGAVFGNLSFPSAGLSRFAEATWIARGEGLGSDALRALGRDQIDPRNRFNSGLPALLLERALGLGLPCHALDAACASSIYAIKTACDWLEDGRADLVLAGAVNCADDLFIHMGFCALNALSRSGRSRPFHAEADGLVPAEGAGFVALKRLDDAIADGSTIHGVLRGIGLSNDGRSRGALVPSSKGQARAIARAYRSASITPGDVSLVECHATGTQIGDATELASMASAFGESGAPIPIGSLKSNFGHPITVAGVAGLIKVLGAMQAETLPPNLPVDRPIAELDSGRFRLVQEAEPWDRPAGGVRRAGISAFGFGGNNGHMIVEEYLPPGARGDGDGVVMITANHRPRLPLAIVGIGVRASDCTGAKAFTKALLAGETRLQAGPDGELEGRCEALGIDIGELGIPPADLRQTLIQQLLMLEVGREAMAAVASLAKEKTGVFVGMGTDAEVARYGARWRVEDWLESLGAGSAGIDELRDAVIPALEAAGVVGTMPNIPANRLNRHFDLQAASCTVSAEERSGLVALELACSALHKGEMDAAIVGAVDLCCEPVHRDAANRLLDPQRRIPGDAAVALVLKRLADAERDGDLVIAKVTPPTLLFTDESDDGATHSIEWGQGTSGTDLSARFGHAHAASGLLHLAAAALSVHHRRRADGQPWVSSRERQAVLRYDAMEGHPGRPWSISEANGARRSLEMSPTIEIYDGADRDEVLDALAKGRMSAKGAPHPGGARLVIVAAGTTQIEARRQRAQAHLGSGAPAGVGVHFRPGPVQGETAFVFSSAGAAYAGMGRELLQVLPELGDQVCRPSKGLAEAMRWVFSSDEQAPTPSERLWAAATLCQFHAQLSLEMLGLQPEAAIGYSSGESSSLFAFGVWRDMDAMRAEIEASGLFDRELGGTFEAIARVWGEPEGRVDWQMWTVIAPTDEVRAAIAGEERLRLAIVHSPSDCVIGGEAEACARVIEVLGSSRCFRLDYNLAVHTPEIEEVRDSWLEVHRREVHPVEGLRFYTGAGARAYVPEREACAEAIYGQAAAELDFPAVIRQAWSDGVRIFVEHGPQGACSGWIREILGSDKDEAVVVALDRKGRGVEQLLDAVGTLLAAGVDVQTRQLFEALEGSGPSLDTVAGLADPGDPRLLVLPSHPDPVRLSAGTHQGDSMIENVKPSDVLAVVPEGHQRQLMAPAPALPSVLGGLLGHEPSPVVQMAAPPVPAAPPAVAAPVASAPSTLVPPAAVVEPNGDGFQAHFAHLSRAHEEFIATQSEVHERFLAMSQRMQAAVMGSARVATVPVMQASVSMQEARPAAPGDSEPAQSPVVAAKPAAPKSPRQEPQPRRSQPGSRPKSVDRLSIARLWRFMLRGRSRRSLDRISLLRMATPARCGCPSRLCCSPTG